jgi:hypothetical protein
MKLSACVAALALAFSAAHAWTFDASDVAPPEDIVGEHQPLQRSWTISSFAQLEQLYLALPGRVFVELDPSLLPASVAPKTEAPTAGGAATDRPGVVAGFTPGVKPGFTPGVVPGFVPGSVPASSVDGSGGAIVPTKPKTEAPKTDGVATDRPGVVAGFTPGVQSGVTPGAEPGFVPGEVVKTGVPAATATETEAPKTEGAATDRPGVVAGFTPGVKAGFTPGVEPGFVPGEGVKTGTPATAETEAPKTEGAATDRPGVVAGFTPGVQSGVTPGAEPGFVPGAVPAGSAAAETRALATVTAETEGEGASTQRPGVVAGYTPGVETGVIPGAVPGFVPGAVPADKTIEVPSMMLRKHHHREEDTKEDESQGEETVVARIVITGNSTDLLSMIEAAPLHPRRNDGLKLHLKNQDAYGEGFVLTKIYLFEKNLLRRVTTAFSGDVVLNDDVVTLDDAEADLKFACVGDGNLYLESGANATLASLEVEVTGNGLAQLAIPSVNLDGSLTVEVAGSGTVALVTDALAANAVKTTLSGSGDIVVDTSDLTAQKLEASVYGSGVASFATAGSVDKESLTLSGPGQLLAGSIVARKASVDVWGDGEMLVQATDRLTVSTSVWGKVGYVNAPPTDVKIKGWWFWREASAIVYPAVVNKVVIYEPAAVPAKYPVYYSIETAESALSDDPDYAFVSSAEALSTVADLMATSLSSVEQASASTDSHGGFFYAFVGAGVVVVNVVAARSWAQRRKRRHYTRLL